jgi:hypothetical protein
LTEVK